MVLYTTSPFESTCTLQSFERCLVCSYISSSLSHSTENPAFLAFFLYETQTSLSLVDVSSHCIIYM